MKKFLAVIATAIALLPAAQALAEATRIEVRLGRRPMQEIARDFGFTSAGFSKTYQRQFGISPSADRRAAIGGAM